MCGYELRKTLSEHGKVARGLCSTGPDGLLDTVEELTDIYRTTDGAENRPPDGPARILSGSETVSMNMWGFQPEVFAGFTAGFVEFLNVYLVDPKAEFYIPLAVDRLIQHGTANCVVLPTAAQWFGVTYQEDKPRVQAALLDIVKTGEYPAPLWDQGGSPADSIK